MIRPAEPGDAQAIDAVHRAAFPTAAEADLVARLEAGGHSAISLVAEREGAVVGHVLFSRMAVTGDGAAWRGLALAPVAVRPAFQQQGIGAELIRGGLAVARATGEEIVFVLGEPAYYGRFGFTAAAAAPFASPYAGPFLMALSFGRPLPAAGRADYAPPFTALEGEGH